MLNTVRFDPGKRLELLTSRAERAPCLEVRSAIVRARASERQVHSMGSERATLSKSRKRSLFLAPGSSANTTGKRSSASSEHFCLIVYLFCFNTYSMYNHLLLLFAEMQPREVSLHQVSFCNCVQCGCCRKGISGYLFVERESQVYLFFVLFIFVLFSRGSCAVTSQSGASSNPGYPGGR